MKISGVIITFNEEKNIERCIRSLLHVTDEIIVIDSFSNDKTEDICKSMNVQFHQHKFDGHIEQKNRAVKFAKNEYVLSLDADEQLSEELIKSISGIDEISKSDAYYFNRLNIYCGKKIKTTSWYPDRKIRLWNKNFGIWGGVNPHDTVVLNQNTRKKFLKGDLLHYSYNSIYEHINQTNKFTEISATLLYEKGKRSSVLKILYKTIFAFFKEYILKYAIFGGFYGFIIAYFNVFYVFLKYSKLLDLQKSKQKPLEVVEST
jgi:glycosyltransferase involved in cell wall biosynthesis